MGHSSIVVVLLALNFRLSSFMVGYRSAAQWPPCSACSLLQTLSPSHTCIFLGSNGIRIHILLTYINKWPLCYDHAALSYAGRVGACIPLTATFICAPYYVVDTLLKYLCHLKCKNQRICTDFKRISREYISIYSETRLLQICQDSFKNIYTRVDACEV